MTHNLFVKRYRPFLIHENSSIKSIKSYLGHNGLTLKKSTLEKCRKAQVLVYFKHNQCYDSFLKSVITTITLQLMDIYSKPTSGLGTILYHFFGREIGQENAIKSGALWGTDPCDDMSNENCYIYGGLVKLPLPEHFQEPTRLKVFTTAKDYANEICADHQVNCLEGLIRYCVEGSDIHDNLACDEEVAWMLTGQSKVYISDTWKN